MRAAPFLFLGFALIAQLQGATASADGSLPLREAQRNLELAELRYRQFIRVEYPLQRLRIDAEITLIEAEIDSMHRRLAEYEPMNRLRGANPLFTDVENLRLSLLDAELQREILRKERCFLELSRNDRLRLLQLEIEAASDLVASLAELEEND